MRCFGNQFAVGSTIFKMIMAIHVKSLKMITHILRAVATANLTRTVNDMGHVAYGNTTRLKKQ